MSTSSSTLSLGVVFLKFDFGGNVEAKCVSKTRFNSRNSCSWMRDGLDFKSETSSGKCGLYDIIGIVFVF